MKTRHSIWSDDRKIIALSNAEQTFLEAWVDMSTREISQFFKIREDSAARIATKVKWKLNVSSKKQAIEKALELGLIDEDG